MFKSGGFLNRVLMGYRGITGDDDIKDVVQNYVMRISFKFALRLI